MSTKIRTNLFDSLSRRLRLWSLAVLLAARVSAAGVSLAGPEVPFSASFPGT